MPQIEVADWKAHTVYNGIAAGGEPFGASGQQAVWFWDVVEALPQAERALLLKFSTGSASVPSQGFEHLMGLHGEKVCIYFFIHHVVTWCAFFDCGWS
jgi:hypothetical protein